MLTVRGQSRHLPHRPENRTRFSGSTMR